MVCRFGHLDDKQEPVADPEISKGGGTDRMLYTPLTAHAHTKLYAQCDSAGKRGGTCPLCPMLDPPLGAVFSLF